MAFLSSIAKQAQRMRRSFCYCTEFRCHRASLSRCSHASRIVITSSRRITPDLGTVIGRIRRSLPTPSIYIAEIMNHFTETLGLSRYTLYMHDYGGPVGFRIALAHPDRVEALIVQDAAGHDEGLGANWKARREFWKNRAANENALRTNLLSLQTTKTRHVGDDPNVDRYDPDLWTDEFYFLNQPGQADIQSDLFYDYRTNVDAYPKWQEWMREHQPRLLVIWGKHDLSFDPGEPERYRKDVPKADVHVLDAGHFALDTKADEIAALVDEFMRPGK